MASGTLTSSEYVKHHLQNLVYGRFNTGGQLCEGGSIREAGSWGWANCYAEAGDMGFMAFHVDSLVWSLVLGVAFILIFGWVAKRATSGVPSKFQSAIESVVEIVDTSVKDSFGGKKDPYIGPIALTIFVWVFLMNLMDLVPVDLLPMAAASLGVHYMKVVPTTDPNITLGLSLSVLILIVVYSIRAKGVSGFIGDLTLHPLGKYFLPFNFVLESIALLAKPISLALRLYGNLFAGELIFIIIALTFGTGNVPLSLVGGLCQIIWAVFHILVIVLQAYIFMMLTIIYLGMAQDEH